MIIHELPEPPADFTFLATTVQQVGVRSRGDEGGIIARVRLEVPGAQAAEFEVDCAPEAVPAPGDIVNVTLWTVP